MHVPVVVLVAVMVMEAEVEGSMLVVGAAEREAVMEPVVVVEGSGLRDVDGEGVELSVAVSDDSIQMAVE